MEARFKLVELTLLLVEILDEAATTLLHLVEASLETHPVGSLVALPVLDLVICDGVLGVPYVVSDEFLNLVFPGAFQIIVVDMLDLVHETLNVLYKNVVSCDEHSLLGAVAAAAGHNAACSTVGGRWLNRLLRV